MLEPCIMNSFICHSTSRLVSTTRLSLCSLALASGIVFTQGAWAADSTPVVPGSQTEATTAHHATATHHNFKGTITAVSSTSLTITKKKTGEAHTFQLSPETTVSVSSHTPGALSDLAIGQYIQVQASSDGSKALHIHVRKSSHDKSHTACNCQTCPGEAKEHNQHHESVTPASSSDKKSQTPATN